MRALPSSVRLTRLRLASAMVQRCEHEHATALAMLNSLSPIAPGWARAAVAAAWRAVEVARRVEARALRSAEEK